MEIWPIRVEKKQRLQLAAMKAIRVAVLTVSDTASADPSADISGPTIRQILSDQGFSVQGSSAIVPDDEHRIRAMIRDWCMTGEVDLIITTGPKVSFLKVMAVFEPSS